MFKLTKKILSVSAFYKSDEDNGLAITIPPDVGNLNAMLAKLQDEFDEAFDAQVAKGNRDSEIARMKAWLDEQGRHHPITDFATGLMVIGFVYLLSKHELIPCDDFNGLLLAAEDTELH